MEFGEAFAKAIESIVRRLRKPDAVCEVVSIDKESNTCELKETGSGKKIIKARLLSVVDDFEKKFVVYPKVGSLVTIAYLFGNSDKAIITKYSEVDEILLNGDEFGGLVKAEKVAERMKRLEDGLEALQQKFNQHTHVTTCGAGAGTAAIPPVASTVVLEPKTNQEFISNNKVKHG